MKNILFDTVYYRIKIINLITKYKVVDYVRISKVMEIFTKKYTPNWSTEVFLISKRLTNPIIDLLEDGNNKNILEEVL